MADSDRARAEAPGSREPSPAVSAASGFDPSRMSRDEKSFLLYAETCCVDQSGLLVGERMNADDLRAAERFVAGGLMHFGRIPANLLKGDFGSETHFVELTLAGWELAWQLRRERSHRKGPYATRVWEHPRTLAQLNRDNDGVPKGGDGAPGSVHDSAAIAQTGGPDGK